MIRNLLILFAVVAISASIPAYLESDPGAIDRFAARFKPAEKVSEVSAPAIREAPAAKTVEIAEPIGRRVRMTMDDRGHFSGEFRLNGRRVSSMVDTGATLVAINQSTARRIGLKLMPVDFKYEVRTANGTTRAAAAKIDSLEIGRIRVSGVEAVVLEDRALDNTLIGMSFLKRLRRFEIEGEMLFLEQ